MWYVREGGQEFVFTTAAVQLDIIAEKIHINQCCYGFSVGIQSNFSITKVLDRPKINNSHYERDFFSLMWTTVQSCFLRVDQWIVNCVKKNHRGKINKLILF